MGKFIDLTGRRFGRLTVIERDTSRKGRAHWFCKCDCGNVVSVYSFNLRNGTTKSCGCLRIEKLVERHITHGLSGAKIHRVWEHIKGRCLNPNDKHYSYYGGRGISIEPSWINDFQAFYDYVSKLEHFGEDGYSLDRIDNDGNYEPGNLRFATMKEQCRNRRNNRIHNINGVEVTTAELAEFSGINRGTVQSRINSGWATEDLTKPLQRTGKKPQKFDVGNGRKLTIKEIATETKLSKNTITERIQKGWAGADLLKPDQTRIPDEIKDKILAEYQPKTYGRGSRALAKKYNVSRSAVQKIVRAK